MAFAPILLAASAAVGAIGAINSAQSQAASYKSQAAAMRYNTQAEMQNATAAQSATNMELDALNTRYRGQAQASGLLAQANLDAYQARAASLNARNSVTGGYIGAASQALGAYSNYYNFRSLNYGYGGT